jgi:hypothetical protein
MWSAWMSLTRTPHSDPRACPRCTVPGRTRRRSPALGSRAAAVTSPRPRAVACRCRVEGFRGSAAVGGRSDPSETSLYHLTGSSGLLALTWQESVGQDPLPGHEFAIPLKWNLGIVVRWTSGLAEDPGETLIDLGSTNGIDEVLDGRCDNADSPPSEDNPEGSLSRGCVDHLFTPTLTYDATRKPRSTRGREAYLRQASWRSHQHPCR